MINFNKTDLYLRLLCRCGCSRTVLTVAARLILQVNIPHRVAQLRKRAAEAGSRNSASVRYLPSEGRLVPAHLAQCAQLFPGQIERCSNV